MLDFVYLPRRNRKIGISKGVYGPMGAGKTDEIIRILSQYRHAISRDILILAPKLDYREPGMIATHDRRIVLPAITVDSTKEMLDAINLKSPSLVVLDETHFSQGSVVYLVQALVNEGIDVLWAGLDNDFRGLSFQFRDSYLTMFDLIARTNFKTQKTALCDYKMKEGNCASPAIFSARYIKNPDGSLILAPYEDKTIAVGGKEGYGSDLEKIQYVYGALCPIHIPNLVGSPAKLKLRHFNSPDLDKVVFDSKHKNGITLREIILGN